MRLQYKLGQLIFSLLLCTFAAAQDKHGKLMGTITDGTKKPMAYATVSLYEQGKLSQPLRRTYTTTKGGFQLVADTGKYTLIISHAGFTEVTTPVTIKSGENVINGLILTTANHTLQNVTVTTRKPLIEQSDDRITYNVENDPAAKSETATEILRKTPLVTVDGDGNVQVNGKGNFKVLLNGRETSMFALNAKEALKNFPGAVISKIEVITSPSAKYDAEGVGGIINIITRKKVIGYNGYLSSYYSTLTNYSENLSLNLKAGKVGISAYAGVGGIAGNVKGRTISETTPFGATAFFRRTLTGERINNNFSASSNLEISYDIDSFQTITAYGSLGNFQTHSKLAQSILTEHILQPSEAGLLLQDNTSGNPNSGIGADFIRKFHHNPEKELSIRFNGQFSKNNGFNTSFQDNTTQDRYVSNNSEAKNREYTFQFDFVQPLKSKKKLETGTKVILRTASSDFQSLLKYNSMDAFKPNPVNTDRFNYRQDVYSAYASYIFNVNKFNVRTGIRAEHTTINGDFVNSQTVVRQQYTNLVPNLLITKQFTSQYTLSASYNMRLQRPYISNLNPFINNNDSLNISYGNPNLGPQVLHTVSVQNRFTKGKLFAVVTLNGSYTNNMIVQYANFNKVTGVTSITSDNIGKEFQTSLNFNLNTPIGDKLNVGFGSQLRYNHIENKGNLLQQRKGISGAAFGNFYYKVIGKFTISGSGGIMRSPYLLVNSPSAQYFYQVNFGYKFMNEKLAVTMNVNNFHDRFIHFSTVTEDPAFRIVSTNINPYRVIYFGATYNFGKLKENVSKKKGVANDDLVQ